MMVKHSAFGKLAFVVIALVHPPTSAGAETWAERLGFPHEKKVVILHARDMGMCYESNEGISRLLQEGAVRSASLTVPCPWFADAARWCGDHSEYDVGLQLTINSEFPNYRWSPVAPDALVASLTDSAGYLWQTPVQTMVNADAADVQEELHAQLRRLRAAGVRPTHLTAHLGTLFTRPDLIERYLRFARQQWIPAVVVEVTPEHLDRFQRLGFALPNDLVQLLADYPLPKVDDLQFLPDAESYAETKTEFLKSLDDLSPGITQLAFAPAVGSDALPRITPDWQRRVWSFELLRDEDVTARLQQPDVVLTDWREIMQRFEYGHPLEFEEDQNLLQSKN